MTPDARARLVEVMRSAILAHFDEASYSEAKEIVDVVIAAAERAGFKWEESKP